MRPLRLKIGDFLGRSEINDPKYTKLNCPNCACTAQRMEKNDRRRFETIGRSWAYLLAYMRDYNTHKIPKERFTVENEKTIAFML